MLTSDLFRAALGQALDGFKIIYFIDDTDRKVTVYLQGKVMVVGFFCTRGKLLPPSSDWLRNFDFLPRVSAGGLVSYQGFREEFDSFEMDLDRVIRSVNPEFLLVSGYSQGGPHAEDLAAKYAEAFGPKLAVHTFGAPRNWTWRSAARVRSLFRRFEVGYQRWQVDGDPVPGLVPVWLGYAHTGPVQKLGEWDSIPWFGRHLQAYYIGELEKLEVSNGLD